MQLVAIVVSLAIAVVGIALFVRAIRQIIAVAKMGQPAHRTDRPAARAVTLLKESLGHTRMLQWSWVGAGHWFIMTGFGLLFFTLVTAFGQLFDPHFALPLIGHFFLWEWVSEVFTFVMLIAIVAFIYYRATRPEERVRGPKGRFWGSTMWQGYFVEGVILGVGLCIAVLRGLEYALLTKGGEHADNASALHFPLSFGLGKAFEGMSTGTIENLIYLVAMLKIVISFGWMITISLQPTMGVAWHRFLAFFNIYFKRHANGRTALGGLAPMTSNGKAIDFEDLEDMDEDTKLGVGAIEDFSWKGLLDFNTCTECGRCQSQCPAWNTEKPLSPKLLITALRDHAYAKAPYVQAGEGGDALLEGNPALKLEAERPLVGDTGDDWFYNPESGAAVIDSEVLWNCTSCGACVQQCPVDIEHVDHIIDMRRYAILVESNFPSELNGLFKGLENKGNPWNMSPKARLDWAKDLPFEVKVVGEDVEDLDEVEWLFWVGCAGAYEDRAKKTTRAVAELLDMAGVSFAVLGNGETCTGDPARRAGNEFVFQGLATENAATLKEAKAKKVVSTCAHCFNTLKNEYAAFGVELEVVHHTQLLNRLVREKKLTPVASNGSADKRQVTYHDPCYIGRHNGVYSPPRELLQVIPDANLVEMPRNSERSFCCGAGGARMWMEENTGERINLNRTKEAVETGADQIAVGCPFCRVMLSDGLTSQQSKGEAREEVEVLDVAQMLLASIKGDSPAPRKATAAPAAAAGGGTATLTREQEEAVEEDTHAEPSSGDATQTENTVTDTEDAGPLAKASGGSSLFDEPEAKDTEAASTGGSLFDDPEPASPSSSSSSSSASSSPAESSAAPAGSGSGGASSGGSLFDLGDDSSSDESGAESTSADTAKVDAESGDASSASTNASSDHTASEDTASTGAASNGAGAASADSGPKSADLGAGGSLFDLGGDDDSDASEPAAASSTAPSSDEPAAEPAGEDPAGDSTTDGPTDRSQDDADTGVRPDADAQDPDARTDNAAPSPETAEQAEESAKADDDAAPAAATSGTTGSTGSTGSTGPASAITPGTEIPEGGSLFDLAEPEEQQVTTTSSTPTPAAEPTQSDTGDAVADEPAGQGDTTAETSDEPAGEDPAGDSTTDGPTDRSQDDADTGVRPDADAQDPDARTDNEAPSPETAEQAEADADADAEDSAKAEGSAEADATAAPSAAAATASTGTASAITPATEIPEGGSLFDLAEPEEQQVTTTSGTPTPAAEPTNSDTTEATAETDDGKPAGEDPAGDSTTDGPTDRSQDDADTGVRPDADAQDPDARTDNEAPSPETAEQAEESAKADGDATSGSTEEAAAPATAPVEASSSAEAGLGGKYPAGTSMFDIVAPAAATSTPAETKAATETPAAAEPSTGEASESSSAATSEGATAESTTADAEAPTEEPAPGATEAASDAPVVSLRDIKAKFSGDSGDSGSSAPSAPTTSDTEAKAAEAPGEQAAGSDDAAPESAEPAPEGATASTDDAEPEATEEKPKGSGEAHQPKTEGIDEASSLFDL